CSKSWASLTALARSPSRSSSVCSDRIGFRALVCDDEDMSPAPPEAVVRTGTRLKALLVHPRLLLSVKTAVAVGIAWVVAPLVPGVADDYPYYAPLGALISMSPTLMSSVRRGAETLAGLAIGILLAGAV